MGSKNIILLLIVLFGILLIINYLPEQSDKVISEEYERVDGNLVSKNLFDSDKQCKESFNENWYSDVQGKCLCDVSSEISLVCGKDGKTYRNLQEVECLGVKVDYKGECVSSSVCGNGVCEYGEADDLGGCGPDADPRCLGPPGIVGTCPQDCENGNDEFCWICGGTCVNFDLDSDSLPPCAYFLDPGFECKIVNGKCTKIPLDAVCGNGICEEPKETSYPVYNFWQVYCPEDCGDESSNSCENLKQEIDNLVDKSNYCDVDSDCISKNVGSCNPILYCAAGFIGNKNEVSKIEVKNNEYEEKCLEPCGLKCPIFADPKIKCQDNKCVVELSS